MVTISPMQSTMEMAPAERRSALSSNAAVISDSTRVNQITPLCKLLNNEGFDVDLLWTEEVTANRPISKSYELAVLDVVRFDDGGQNACSRLRALDECMPIVVLSQENTVTDRIRGFESGADDFIGKPYSAREVSARLRSLMRRSGSVTPQNVLRYEDLTIDLASRVAYRGDRYIDLSRREFALLSYLMRHAEQVMTREQLLENVWANSTNLEKSNVVDVYINYLRNKTEQGRHNRLIQTVRGKGYMLHRQHMA